jgi:hypothetical protein
MCRIETGGWLTGWKAESGRTGREQTLGATPVNSLITAITLLTILALSDGSLVIDVPAWTGPTVNRGLE